MYPLLQPEWVGMRRGQKETLSWPRANSWLQTCSPASPISIALDIKDNGPVTTQQECRRSPQLGILKAKRQEGPFKHRSLMQPHSFGLTARAAGEIPQAVFCRRTASGPQRAPLWGRRSAKPPPGQRYVPTHRTTQIDRLRRKSSLIITARFLATEQSSPFIQAKEGDFCSALNNQSAALTSLHGTDPRVITVTVTQTQGRFQ